MHLNDLMAFNGSYIYIYRIKLPANFDLIRKLWGFPSFHSFVVDKLNNFLWFYLEYKSFHEINSSSRFLTQSPKIMEN